VYPLGGLAVGALAATGFGPRATILLNAAVCALGGLLFLRATRARGADDMERLREAEEGSPIAP
jgi:hypothetical protein